MIKKDRWGRKPKKPPARTGAPDDTRNAPDPFTAVLPAIAALGAVSSIATINWAAQDKTPERAKSKRKASTALRDLETCCIGLLEIFKRFARHPELFYGEGGTKSSPLKFGVHGPRVTIDQARIYHQLMNDVASMLVLASQNAFDVMSAVEDGELNPPESVFFGFGECLERLNELIQSRATMKDSVGAGLEVAQKLITHVREIKEYHVE